MGTARDLAEAERAAGVGMITNTGEQCTTLATMGRPAGWHHLVGERGPVGNRRDLRLIGPSGG